MSCIDRIERVIHKFKDGTVVIGKKTEVSSANILEVEAGTTGFMGGDSSHGCRTYFTIRDLASTDMNIKVLADNDNDRGGFEVELGGDTELDTIVDALKFITTVLELEIDMAKKLKQCENYRDIIEEDEDAE